MRTRGTGFAIFFLILAAARLGRGERAAAQNRADPALGVLTLTTPRGTPAVTAALGLIR